MKKSRKDDMKEDAAHDDCAATEDDTTDTDCAACAVKGDAAHDDFAATEDDTTDTDCDVSLSSPLRFPHCFLPPSFLLFSIVLPLSSVPLPPFRLFSFPFQPSIID